MEKYKESWREPEALTSAINYYRANVLRKLLKPQPPVKIKVPTLFIYGEKDTAVLPETVQNVKDAIDAHYEEIRIPESGHWLQQEAAEAELEVEDGGILAGSDMLQGRKRGLGRLTLNSGKPKAQG